MEWSLLVLHLIACFKLTHQILNNQVPTITLETTHNKTNSESQYAINFFENITEIKLLCQSKKPIRWIWKPIIEDFKIEIRKERTETLFISSLIVKPETVAGGRLPDINCSCTTEMRLQAIGLVSCVVIRPVVKNPSLIFVEILSGIQSSICTNFTNSDPRETPNLTVDLEAKRASCEPQTEWEPDSNDISSLDHGEVRIISNSNNPKLNGSVSIGKITSNVGKNIFKNYDFPHIVYCEPYDDVTSSTIAVLYPGYKSNVWENFTFYPSLEDATNIFSVQSFAVSEKDSPKNFTPRTHFAENEKIKFVCRAIRFLYMHGFQIKIGNTSLTDFQNSSTEEGSKFIEVISFITLKRSFGNTLNISCGCPIWNSEKWKTSSIQISIFPVEKPTVNLIKHVDLKNIATVNCSYTGWPRPNVTWTTSQSVVYINETSHIPNENGYRKNNNSWYQLKTFFIGGLNALEVTCNVENFVGGQKASKMISKGEKISTAVLYTIIFVSIAVFIASAGAIVLVYIQYRKKLLLYTQQRKLTVEEIEEFYSGAAPNSVEYEALQMPYNSDYEVQRNDLVLDGTILGSGHFGLVLKGTIGPLTVAVKTVKPTADIIYLKSLLSELKILQFVGPHRNIVNLIGANTANIKKKEVLLVLDYCLNGSLVDFLRQCRDRFVDFFGVASPQNKQVPLYENSKGITLTTQNLILFAYEIASAMDHIASKNVIHGDLAARNILVTEDLHVKLCDFGLAKQLLHYSVYVQKVDFPLPLRWMAIESLQDMEFSQASDRWSYGVCLWEIFSLAELPYPGVQWSFESYKTLLEGYRMAKPNYANNSIYNLMLECWNAQPQKRPQYKDIIRQLKEEEDRLT